MTIEQKLQLLADCGLKLKEQFSVSDLINSWGRPTLDQPGYNLTLVCLGMTQESPPWTPHCDNLWHFDTECIEGDGSYAKIAQRMAEMAQGSLPLSDVEDHIDIDNEKAWLHFTCQGQRIEINCQVKDDWVDPKIFRRFVILLHQTDPSKIFIYSDLGGGQDCILGCLSRDNFAKLQKLLPQFQPLS